MEKRRVDESYERLADALDRLPNGFPRTPSHVEIRLLKKIFSPNLERALVFLDDSLLPSTSNAVERGNRRHNKMQKSVYRVRCQLRIEQRVALDMLRDDPTGGRSLTTVTLHLARTG